MAHKVISRTTLRFNDITRTELSRKSVKLLFLSGDSDERLVKIAHISTQHFWIVTLRIH